MIWDIGIIEKICTPHGASPQCSKDKILHPEKLHPEKRRLKP
jgi:hypothetical protein